MKKPVSLLRLLDDPNLFGRFFPRENWKAWRVFLAALFALPADEGAQELYHEHTGREAWPAVPFNEAALIVGRRGGKSRILALIAVYLACFRNYLAYLAPGETAKIAVLAVNREQAAVIFDYVVGMLEGVPLLRPRIVSKGAEEIVLSNRVVIVITTSSFRSARGRTFAAVLADEVAFWHSDETSQNPDVEIMRALRPGLATIPGSILIMASSPYARRGELYAAYRRHYGKDAAKVLVWKAATRAMNPLERLTALIDEAYELDPEAARAEFGAEFRDDLADYVSVEAVDAVTCWGRSELPPEPGVVYSGFVDPSGGSKDAMTLAIGHLAHSSICVVDALLEIRPPFDPEKAVEQCATLLRRYGVEKVIGDRYAGEWPKARFREHGIEFEQSARPKSDLYGDLLSIINAQRVEFLDHTRLRAQLAGLERRTARSGKDSIDHAPGGHDDLVNAVAGVLVGLDLDRRQPLVELKDVFATDGKAPPLPRHCGAVFAVVAMEGADVAVVVAGHEPHQSLLYILDVVAGPLWRSFFDDAVVLLKKLRRACTAPTMAIFTPVDLIPLFQKAAFAGAERLSKSGAPNPAALLEAATLVVRAPPDWFDAELSLAFAAGMTGQGLIKFCAPVADKMATQTIGAALAFRAGDAVEMALRAAFIQAICLKYDERLTSRPRPAA